MESYCKLWFLIPVVYLHWAVDISNNSVYLPFLIGQAKLAIFKSHRCKNAGEDTCMVTLFKEIVHPKIKNFKYTR